MIGRRVQILLVGVACSAACVLPSTAGPRGFANAPRSAAIFYYPWYANPARDGHWDHWYALHKGGTILSTEYEPSRGLYSSSSAAVVASQMREIAVTGVTTLVVSWWGFGSPEDARLPLVARAAARQGLRVAIHLEPYVGRTPASAASDIARLHHEDGLADFYVYGATLDPADEWSKALEPLADVRVFGQTTLVGRARASGFDGVYTYDVVTWNGSLFRRLCTQAHAAGLLCGPSVGPGYDARHTTGQTRVRERLDGATYDRMWKAAVRSGADVVTVTSYNEWQEGTQIEPARVPAARAKPRDPAGAIFGRASYEGAWGKSGIDAERAYLAATARWTARLAEVSAPRRKYARASRGCERFTCRRPQSRQY